MTTFSVHQSSQVSSQSHQLQSIVAAALAEDLGERGDITSEAFVPKDSHSSAIIVAREEAVLAGVEVAEEVFRQFDATLEFRWKVKEGDFTNAGTTLLALKGSTRSILGVERTLLNFLERLSGVATYTRRYVEAVAPYEVTILDTRKMTPGWRLLEKQAVVAGGGSNHRIGLFDAVLVKDNHLMALAETSAERLSYGSQQLPEKLRLLRKNRSYGSGLKIELEADTLEQVSFFLTLPEVDAILLDNMSPQELQEAVKLREKVGSDILLEASGGVTLKNITAVAATGIDAISIGALTHSAPWSDFSLELTPLGHSHQPSSIG